MRAMNRAVDALALWGFTCLLFGPIYTCITIGALAGIVYYKIQKEANETN